MNKLAEITVSYSRSDYSDIKINSTNIAYDVFREAWNMDTIELFEEFKILYLNRSNEVLGIYNHSKGGISGTCVDQRLIFATALKCNASSIIVCHNHPSGNLKPSESDIKLTKMLKNCGEILDVAVTDHLIISKNGFTSFVRSGLM